MSCSECIKSVQHILERHAGVRVYAVELGHASLDMDPSQTSLETMLSALAHANFISMVQECKDATF